MFSVKIQYDISKYDAAKLQAAKHDLLNGMTLDEVDDKHDGLGYVALMKINLSSYIVSTTNVLDYDISYFEGIEFVGGTLLNLKMPMGMKIDYDVEAAKRYIEHVDDTQTFSFSTEKFSCKVTIGSSTNEHHGLTGASLTNGNIHFEMEFDKPQTTSKAYLHYNKVRELLSFLVNRCDVGFDEMYLLQKDENHPGMM